MGCCRRAFSVMCFRRNVLLLGQAHVVNDLQWASCCQAAKMRMTGSTSCYPRRTCGLPSQHGVQLRRNSLLRYSAKSGEGCRPSQHLWMVVNLKWGVSVDRMYVKALTGKSKEGWRLCSLTGLPDATAQTLMMKRSIVGLDSERFKHGGKHVKIGWDATKRTGNRSSMTSRSCWRHYLTRKQLHSQKWIHSWRIAAKRWQTREGTYQLKRRRLPDVRDLPEYSGTDIDMEDI